MRFLRGFALLSLIVALLAVPATASAAPPNDNRADAIRVTPPQTVTGTLVGSTLEPVGDVSECGTTDGSVWYRFTAPKRGVIIQLDADGEMDATVDVFERNRSRLQFFDCAATDNKGVATLDTDGWQSGAEYAIRVGNEAGSVADRFTLRVLVPAAPPEPPGKRLPAKGAKGSVDRLVDPGNAYWTRLSEGRTMRMNLATTSCTSVEVYGPDPKSFSGQPVLRSRCGGYRLFTASESGRYSFLVQAGRSREVQRYRLQVERARADDTAPGVFIGNHARVSGRVNGGIDSLDLYRFDVTRRSELALRVTGGLELQLRRNGGQYLDGGSSVSRVVRPGRYFVAVEGQGKYRLTRVSRAVTTSVVRFNGKKKAAVTPGTTVRLQLLVRPDVSGRGIMVVQRQDPVAGWQFYKRYRVGVGTGDAQVSFRPPSVGRYRATGEFLKNRNAAASSTGVAKLLVRGPLVD